MLYDCEEAKEARRNKNTVQIKYPAKLFIQGRLVRDMFPDWFPNLRESRLPETHLIRKSKQEGKIIKEVSYQPNTVLSAHQGQYSVYARTTIDEANRTSVYLTTLLPNKTIQIIAEV